MVAIDKEFYLPRAEKETARAYRAKQDYLSLGPGRSLEKLLTIYRARKQDEAGTPPTTLKATLARWSTTWGWVTLADKYDAFTGDRLLEQQLEERKKSYHRQLEEFREKHLAVGRAGFKAGAQAITELVRFLDTHPEIKDWNQANQAANLIARLQPLAELWSKALILDRVLANWEEEF